MPHRKGSFHEDVTELLRRFAHKGKPAASKDQLTDAKRKKDQRDSSNAPDVHDSLFGGRNK